MTTCGCPARAAAAHVCSDHGSPRERAQARQESAPASAYEVQAICAIDL